MNASALFPKDSSELSAVMSACSFSSVSYPLKLFSPLTCHQCLQTAAFHHCLAFSFPILSHLLPTGYRKLTFPKLSDRSLPQRKEAKHSLQNSNRPGQKAGILPCVGNWIYGSLLQFVITSWALKHCPNMFCCESTDPVWHYLKRERATRHHY